MKLPPWTASNNEKIYQVHGPNKLVLQCSRSPSQSSSQIMACGQMSDLYEQAKDDFNQVFPHALKIGYRLYLLHSGTTIKTRFLWKLLLCKWRKENYGLNTFYLHDSLIICIFSFKYFYQHYFLIIERKWLIKTL